MTGSFWVHPVRLPVTGTVHLDTGTLKVVFLWKAVMDARLLTYAKKVPASQ